MRSRLNISPSLEVVPGRDEAALDSSPRLVFGSRRDLLTALGSRILTAMPSEEKPQIHPVRLIAAGLGREKTRRCSAGGVPVGG